MDLDYFSGGDASIIEKKITEKFSLDCDIGKKISNEKSIKRSSDHTCVRTKKIRLLEKNDPTNIDVLEDEILLDKKDIHRTGIVL